MNLNYIKEYLEVRKDNITSADIENLIKEISDYQATEGTFTDIAKIMRVVNEYNLTFLTLVEAYEAYPKGDIKLLPKRAEKAREILCVLSSLHTYLVLSLNMVKESTYNMKGIRNYMSELGEKKEHFKSEKMTWATILRSLTQEMSFTQEMRKMDIEDQVGYIKYRGQ
jgi:hypothetical protein